MDQYYEIDLRMLLENQDLENFRYFYYFFRKEAFLPSKHGTLFIEDVLKGSESYAKEIGENLKENVYRAMKFISDGFFHWRGNNLDFQNDTIREEVQKSTMRLLYRFLFLLYSEGKGLLDLTNDVYREFHSFNKLKHDVAEKMDGPSHNFYSQASTSIWSKLGDLFRLINEGSEADGIPREDFHVPAYNGGLFEPDKNPKLTTWRIGDTYLAEAIDLLARSRESGRGEKVFVDYSTLDIKHLGSIYEGLLEYKLKIADIDLVVKGTKKKKWVTLEEYNKGRKNAFQFEDFDEFSRVRAGDLYLATDKGDRKATGSYYTPDYIVKYIVENAVGPVVDGKIEEARKNKTNLSDAVLSAKVLDPAMGSGHFLVGALEFLAGKLLAAVHEDTDEGRIEANIDFTLDWAKREVVSHCIYGVDLNELAVELAKVSLWLKTISKDKPLSFLDHRLKCGNSLIGVNLEELPWHPNKKVDKKERRVDIPEGFIKKLLGTIDELGRIDDSTIENIKKKEEIFEELKRSRVYDMIKTLADLKASLYFGNEVDEETYGNYTGHAFWSDKKEWVERRDFDYAKMGRFISRENHFFHWELEFPEIFYEEGKLKDNQGFHSVIGNPPYGANFSKMDVTFLQSVLNSLQYGAESYVAFMEKCSTLLSENGISSLIVPDNWMYLDFTEKLRLILIQNYKFRNIVALPSNVFQDAAVDTCIYILSNEKLDCPENFVQIIPYDKTTNINMITEKGRFEQEQSYWLNSHGHIINPYMLPSQRTIVEKCKKNAVNLENLTEIKYGLKSYQKGKGTPKQTTMTLKERPFTSQVKTDDTFYPFFEGQSIDRYLINWNNDNWLKWGPWLAEPRSQNLFKGPRLLFRKVVGSRLLGTYYFEDSYSNTLLYIISIRNEIKYDLKSILAILNSTLLGFLFRKIFAIRKDDTFPQILLDDIASLPIHTINFITPLPRRQPLLKEGKELYQDYLTTSNPAPFLSFIESRLPKDKKGNFLTEKEESDVIHDILAFLSDRMVELNKLKHGEVRGFHEWLEREIEGKIDVLTNKTILKKVAFGDNFSLSRV